jgi:hypothetical protein
MIEFFNNLNPLLDFASANQEFSLLVPYLLIFLGNALYYLLFLLKFYRIMCFSKITFDGLPMINPYVWPFSIFRVLTQPYFKFWSKIFPTFKSGKSSFDISLILALEGISALIYFLTQVRVLMLIEAASLISKISS